MPEMLYYLTKVGPRLGTLRQYISQHYPLYAMLGLFTWEDIYDYLTG